jgi:hypothetical protein
VETQCREKDNEIQEQLLAAQAQQHLMEFAKLEQMLKTVCQGKDTCDPGAAKSLVGTTSPTTTLGGNQQVADQTP